MYYITYMMHASGKKLYYFNKALEYIDSSDTKQCHGAVLVKGGKIISCGRNQTRGRVLKKNVCSTHAEVDSINNLAMTNSHRRLKRRVLYNKGYHQRCKKHKY